MTRMLLVLALATACSKKSEPADKPAADPTPTTPEAADKPVDKPADTPTTPSIPPPPESGSGGDKAKLPCIVPATFAPLEAEGADVFLIAAGKDSTAPKGGLTATLRLPRPYNLSRAYLRLVGEHRPQTIELRPVEGDATCAAEGCALVEFMYEGANERAPAASGTIVIEQADATRVTGYIANAKVVEPREPACAMVVERLSFDLDLARAMTY